MMKTTYSSLLMMALMSAFLMQACTDTTTNVDEPEDELDDIYLVPTIVGEALSGQHEGFMSSLYDLTATVEEDRLRYPNNRDWRSPNNNWNYTYNPENGVHTIQFRRGFIGDEYSNIIQVLLNYVFEDADGNYISSPRENSGDIETVRFRGLRTGEAESPWRQSEFERKANWFLEGFNDNIMSLNGKQEHSGSMMMRGREGRTMMRMYNMEFDLVDISIERPTDENDLIEASVSGLIEYTVTVRRSDGENYGSHTYTGTIEIDHGMALLRVMGLERTFNIDLVTGGIIEYAPGRE